MPAMTETLREALTELRKTVRDQEEVMKGLADKRQLELPLNDED